MQPLEWFSLQNWSGWPFSSATNLPAVLQILRQLTGSVREADTRLRHGMSKLTSPGEAKRIKDELGLDVFELRRQAVSEGRDPLLAVAKELRLQRIFVLTFETEFFGRHGFAEIEGTPVTAEVYEEMCRSYHEITGASIAMLRYHEFVPAPYLTFGPRLLRNGVDRQDVADATVAALTGAVEHRFGLFRTIVHTDHGIPDDVLANFPARGPAWLETQVPGAIELIANYDLHLPERVEQHDLSEARDVIGWEPKIGFVDFLRDLKGRDARGEDVRSLVVPGTMVGIA